MRKTLLSIGAASLVVALTSPFWLTTSASATPTSGYHLLGAPAYAELRWQVISHVEGAVDCPYADSKGKVTIGIGFNLTDQTTYDAAMDTLAPGLTPVQRKTFKKNVINQKYPAANACDDDNEVIPAVKAQMDTFNAQNAASHTGVVLPTALSFGSVAAMRSTFEVSMTQQYEPRVDHWLAGIPDSIERTALVSLGYNSANLLGNQLSSDITNGNRAEAWFEIRYASAAENNAKGAKADAGSAAGLIKRRDLESDLFGLYEGNPFNPVTDTVSNTDATQAASMVAAHEAWLYPSVTPDNSGLYNNKYFVNPDSHDGSNTIATNEIGTANRDYQSVVAAVQAVDGAFAVRDLADDIAPAVADLSTNPGAVTNGTTIVQHAGVALDLSGGTGPAAVILQAPGATLTMGTANGLVYANSGVTINVGNGLEELTIGSGQNTIRRPTKPKILPPDTVTFEGHSIATTVSGDRTDAFGRKYSFDGKDLTITNGTDKLTIQGFKTKDFGVRISGLVADSDGVGVLDLGTADEWLPLPITTSDTYNTVVGGHDPAIPTGYVIATDAQVQQLFLDAGFPALSNTDGFQSASFVDDGGVLSRTFFTLFGIDDAQNNLTAALSIPTDFEGITGTPPNVSVGPFSNDVVYGPSPQTFNHDESVAVMFTDEIGLNPDFASGNGYFMVKSPTS